MKYKLMKEAAFLEKNGYKIKGMPTKLPELNCFIASNRSGDPVYVKVFNFHLALPPNMRDDYWKCDAMLSESIQSPFLVKVLEKIRTKHRVYLVQEFTPMDNVYSYILTHGVLDPSVAVVWFYQMLLGVKYMHENLKIAHRNIKVNNIFLYGFVAKISDFGFTCKGYEDDGTMVVSDKVCGMPCYMSPEMLVDTVQFFPIYSDYWALGVCLFIMINGTYPFIGPPEVVIKGQMLKAYKNRFNERTCSKRVKLLIEHMFEFEVSKRPTLNDIINWFKTNSSKSP